MKLSQEMKRNLVEFGTFLDACDTDEQNLHRLLGVPVEEAIEYQEFLGAYAKKRRPAYDRFNQGLELANLLLLFGAWFALYKRKKR